jgi:hypothetical protein
MTTAAKRIELEIRQLPLEDILVLHQHLVVTIHGKEAAEPLDPTFRDEIQRRVKEIASGQAWVVDAFEAHKKM